MLPVCQNPVVHREAVIRFSQNHARKVMKAHVIIPARGGSKGVPGKNLVKIAGVSLLERSIRAAQNSIYCQKVWVTSDDDAILAAAIGVGAKAIKRPDRISRDISSSEDALLHALEEISGSDELGEYTVFLQCTSPFTIGSDIDQLVDTLIKNGGDSGFSASRSHAVLWSAGQSGEALPMNHDGKKRERRQDSDLLLEENGAAYVFKTAGFLENRFRFFGKTVFSEMPALRSIQIDEPEDLIAAEQTSDALGETSAFRIPDGLAPIKTVLFDFDGVFTNNKVYLSENGVESVRCDRGDGFGIEMLRKAGLRLAVVSKERNIVVEKRCEKLKLDVWSGVDDKESFVQELLKKEGKEWETTLFIGNDLNDLACIQRAGFSACPSDAVPAVLEAAKIKLKSKGGEGAVRELCDLLITNIQTPSQE